jgi:hypothetical protein
MRTLSERDAAEVMAVAAEISALEEPEPFPPQLLGRLAALLRPLRSSTSSSTEIASSSSTGSHGRTERASRAAGGGMRTNRSP